MKIGNTTTMNVENYRRLVQTYIDLHMYSSALFWADKIVAITETSKDVYWMAQCMYLLKQYHRAVHLLTSRDLVKSNVTFINLTIKCLYEANELNEALKIVNSVGESLFDLKHSIAESSDMDELDIFSKNQTIAAFLYLKGKVLEGMDNRGLAADCYKQALILDVHCFEAFDSLIRNQMLTAADEEELMKSLPIAEQCSAEEAEILQSLYESRLKKYHAPTMPRLNESKILYGSSSNRSSSKINVTPSPDNVSRNNDKNLKSDAKNKSDNCNSALLKLKNSLDLQVTEAERLYYNYDFQQCSQLTEAILKVDPYHDMCLPIHISCQVELKQSNKLFSLAHNLVDLYPHLAISWFAVGCYYYIIGKSDFARRYLAKATSIDRLFGPAWLAYGHSFAIENEHDQAMAAYFKASQLMKGCHLPLLYIGLECGLTNNYRLADKFFFQAQSIAPDDPFIMHEKGVISFQNVHYEIAEMYFRSALESVKKIKRGVIPQRWSPLLNNLGHTSRKLKKYEEALDFHHQALLLNPHASGTYSAIAYCHVLIGNNDEAVEWFHKALGLKRDDTFSTTMLNYIIEQLSEENSPYLGCPGEIPKYELESKSRISVNPTPSNVTESGVSGSSTVDISMSIEVDMPDVSGN